MIAEPAVALTNFALALECGLFATLLRSRGRLEDPLARWFVVFFAATALGSLGGGTVHGFFPDASTTAGRILWRATLVAIGGATAGAWGIAARLGRSSRLATWIELWAMFQLGLYAALVLRTPTFGLAVANYLPATIFLLAVFLLARQHDARARSLGAAALMLTFVAAGVQQARIPLHPGYFDHNAFFHLIQGVALLLLFASAWRLVRR